MSEMLLESRPERRVKVVPTDACDSRVEWWEGAPTTPPLPTLLAPAPPPDSGGGGLTALLLLSDCSGLWRLSRPPVAWVLCGVAPYVHAVVFLRGCVVVVVLLLMLLALPSLPSALC